MKAVLLSLALLGPQLTTPVSARVPELNVEAICKTRSAEARLARMHETRSVAECVSDENSAKLELNTVWGSTSRSIRNQCQSDEIAIGMRGYLDLLVCTYIKNDTKRR